MQILALETSTDACSVALYLKGEVTSCESFGPKQHSHLLLPMVSEVLAKAGTTLNACDAVAFGRGPGSFTGLRIAASVAQGLAFGVSVPIIPISTLAAIAYATKQSFPNRRYVATIDARMQELYWAIYEDQGQGMVELQAEQLTSIEGLLAVVANQPSPLICGPGWPVYAPVEAPFECVEPKWPSAVAIAELAVLSHAAGGGLDPAAGLPLYVRDDVVQSARTRPK